MVRPEVVRKRLNRLDEYLAILKNMQSVSYDEFSQNPEKYGSVERFLHLAVEAVTDIGNHIIAEENLGMVNSYSDIPGILKDKGVIDEALCQTWIRMIGFRNALVHDYVEIDFEIVYDVLQNHIQDLESIKKVFSAYL